MVVGKLKTVVVVVVLAVLAFVLRAVYNTATVQFGVLHTAESVIEQADGVWEKALAAEDAAELSKALKLYTILLNSPPLKPIVRIQSPNATAESVITAAVASAFVWLARPLRLRRLKPTQVADREIQRIRTTFLKRRTRMPKDLNQPCIEVVVIEVTTPTTST